MYRSLIDVDWNEVLPTLAGVQELYLYQVRHFTLAELPVTVRSLALDASMHEVDLSTVPRHVTEVAFHEFKNARLKFLPATVNKLVLAADTRLHVEDEQLQMPTGLPDDVLARLPDWVTTVKLFNCFEIRLEDVQARTLQVDSLHNLNFARLPSAVKVLQLYGMPENEPSLWQVVPATVEEIWQEGQRVR